MGKLLYILLFISFIYVSDVFSQTYGNEWINYGQKYYSIPIVNSGVYKLDYDALNSSLIPLSTFSSQNIQMFGREKEIPLYVVDGGDSSIDPGDYILFYAERNDGWLDSTLYDNPTLIGNPDYSLFNDTISYFFTWNNLTTNSRYVEDLDVDFASYTPSTYVLQKVRSNYFSAYNNGGNGDSERNSHSSSSFYKGAEGFGLPVYCGAGTGSGCTPGLTLNLSIPTLSPYTGVDAPLVKFKGISTTNSEASYSGLGNHHVSWRIGASDYLLADRVLTNYATVFVDETFSASVLSPTTTPLKWIIIDDLGVASDRQQLNYWSLIYPKTPTLDGGYTGDFRVVNNTLQNKIRLDFTNTAVSNPLVFVTGGGTNIKANLTSFNGGYSTLIYNSLNGANQRVIIQDLSTAYSLDTVRAVNGTGVFTDYSLVDSDSSLLMIYHKFLNVAGTCADYKNYRESNAGGGHNVVFSEIGELYLQFGGGINKHINGIRRFAHFMYNKAAIKPVGLFLMGKGISVADYSLTPGSRTNGTNYALNLVPSFGEPASDLAITAKLNGNVWEPLIPTGRISVDTEAQLLSYLNKVVQYDAQQDPNSIYSSEEKDWQKKIIHLGGGQDAALQSSIQSYLNSMKTTAEDSLFAGSVRSVFKSTSAPIDPTLLNDVTQDLHDGVSLMTHFGHGSTGGFDLTLDDPSVWNNVGKYPVMISNSCFTSNMFVNVGYPAVSEKYVRVDQGGVIAFVGMNNSGYDSPLSTYSNELYHQFSYENYNRTLAYQMKKTIKALELIGYDAGSGNSNLYLETACSQMNLLGDPMLKINSHEYPEIELRPENVTFSPENLDYTVEFIDVQIVLNNLGKSITDTFTIEIKRDFPLSSVDSLYYVKVPYLNYRDTIHFNMPLQPNIGIGINYITVSVDIPSVIVEQYDEVNNNRTIATLFVDIDGIIPVVPSDFAVVPIDSVTVKACTVDPLAEFQTYRFELDTTDLFNSPIRRYAYVSGLGGVKEVNPSDWKFTSSNASAPLVCTDSTVYFWRVAIDSLPYIWKERSFQYITGKTGWGQDHFFQFKKNDFSKIIYNRDDREREFFSDAPDSLRVRVLPNFGGNSYWINGIRIEHWHCTGNPELVAVVIDPISHAPWKTRYGTANPNNNFGNQNDNGGCVGRPVGFFNFPQTSVAYLDSFQNMLLNHVPDSFYILVYTTGYAKYSAWDVLPTANNLYSTFASLGSTAIVPGLPNGNFAFFCKKGNPNSVVEMIDQSGLPGPSGTGGTGVSEFTVALPNKLRSGIETSTLIGPASEWGSLFWKQDSLDLINRDSTSLRIQAFDITGALQYEVDTMFTKNDSIINLSSIVNATFHPYIKLSAFYLDTTNFTPAQIDRWHVLYTPLPEAAIDGSTQYTWIPSKDTLDEGEDVKFAVDVKNIFTLPMDSILISYWIEDASHVKHPLPYARQKPLLVNEVIRDTITFSTLGYAGINSLWMEVNPYINGSIYVTDQPEQEHFNNLLQIPFYVNGDDVNPILDVTFDGRHILNGDIVSPTSEIFITLKDDNPHLVMDNDSDTTLFGIFITDPNGVQKRIPFMDGNGNAVMYWTPADETNKRFKINYPALFTVDGKYTLLVQGTDRSGNLSGDLQYKISFEIIRESSITYLMNYPNPFSTSTRFVFTLTGTEVPDNVIIQIMTVTGKVVREITEAELGAIYIGRNISSYEWNGTDEFGDPLANGVYLYRVKAQIKGEEIKHRETGGDSYFTKDFGKMYIMR